LNSFLVMVLEKISPFMIHVEQMETISSLNSQVQELSNAMVRWNESFKPTKLNIGGLEDILRTSLWSECARTTTILSNISSIKVEDKCPYQLMYGRKPKLPTSFRTFGEIGMVTPKDDIQGKLKNLGLTCIFVGYSGDHANDVYRMFNFNSKWINQTRVNFWIRKCYNNWSKNNYPSNDNNSRFHGRLCGTEYKGNQH
jgi:hypothetical protein